jgi:hypothetical protein
MLDANGNMLAKYTCIEMQISQSMGDIYGYFKPLIESQNQAM